MKEPKSGSFVLWERAVEAACAISTGAKVTQPHEWKKQCVRSLHVKQRSRTVTMKREDEGRTLNLSYEEMNLNDRERKFLFFNSPFLFIVKLLSSCEAVRCLGITNCVG
ncbi:hypothetical protein MA16_Dca015210 [Dendrobium catenatum]|uniref:Uncharacterized protein n=1 Tax=Dendrobium catenatum TaxID=906689 RepID=A0A2I0VSB9_9ASPA|nr:hypothetical protein MA16_Dca015210 [Dendrobium catenatum]